MQVLPLFYTILFRFLFYIYFLTFSKSFHTFLWDSSLYFLYLYLDALSRYTRNLQLESRCRLYVVATLYTPSIQIGFIIHFFFLPSSSSSSSFLHHRHHHHLSFFLSFFSRSIVLVAYFGFLTRSASEIYSNSFSPSWFMHRPIGTLGILLSSSLLTCFLRLFSLFIYFFR